MQMTHGIRQLGIALVAGVVGLAGCSTPDRTPNHEFDKPEVARDVRDADSLFQQGRYTDAIVACIDIARKDALTPGLSDLQTRIMTKMSQLRRDAIQAQQAATAKASAVDALRHGSMPDTYNLKRHVVGETTPLRTAPTAMQLALRKSVSLNFTNGPVDLNAIIAQISADENVNIVADAAAGEGKSITVKASEVPLAELLEYIGCNMEVTFNVGQNLIWVTPRTPEDGTRPFETRVYRLRKGLPGNEVPGGAALGVDAQPGSGEIAIVEAITRFVPQPQGADISFDTRAHALFVKNTRDNLSMAEDIINAMDVRPLQVLIEARFINTKATDTRALGIDWLLGGPTANPSAPWVTPAVNSTLNTLTIPDGASLTATQTANGESTTVSENKLTLSGDPLGVGQLQDGAGAFLYQGVLDDLRLKAVLRAMESSGQTRTLTVPRVTTVNNRTAMIHIGEEFQYYDNLTTPTANYYNNNNNNTPNQVVNNNTPTFQGTPKTIKLGYKLTVTPSIGADLSTINLVLIPDITELLNKSEWEIANTPGKATVQTVGKLPIVLQKTIETEVVVRSGETVVMGGLAQASGGKTRNGLPWISHLPFLGWLFRTEESIDGTDNLLVFVTATILSDIGEELIPLNPREPVGAPLPLVAVPPPAAPAAEAEPPAAPAPAAANPQPGA